MNKRLILLGVVLLFGLVLAFNVNALIILYDDAEVASSLSRWIAFQPTWGGIYYNNTYAYAGNNSLKIWRNRDVGGDEPYFALANNSYTGENLTVHGFMMINNSDDYRVKFGVNFNGSTGNYNMFYPLIYNPTQNFTSNVLHYQCATETPTQISPLNNLTWYELQITTNYSGQFLWFNGTTSDKFVARCNTTNLENINGIALQGSQLDFVFFDNLTACSDNDCSIGVIGAVLALNVSAGTRGYGSTDGRACNHQASGVFLEDYADIGEANTHSPPWKLAEGSYLGNGEIMYSNVNNITNTSIRTHQLLDDTYVSVISNKSYTSTNGSGYEFDFRLMYDGTQAQLSLDTSDTWTNLFYLLRRNTAGDFQYKCSNVWTNTGISGDNFNHTFKIILNTTAEYYLWLDGTFIAYCANAPNIDYTTLRALNSILNAGTGGNAEIIIDNFVAWEIDGINNNCPEGPTQNDPPTHSTPLLNSTLGTNLTTENLTVYNQSTYDADGDSVKNIINWYINENSITLLNMPFEGGNHTKDYSGYSNNGTFYNVTWNKNSGHDGFGAYEFNGVSSRINLGYGTSNSLRLTDNFTVSLWFKDVATDATLRAVLGRYSSWLIQANTGNNYMRFYYIDGAGANHVLKTSNFIYNKNTWTNIVVVFSADNTLVNSAIYINGVNANATWALGNGTTPIRDTSNYLGIGSGFGEGNLWNWNGSIDDVIMFKDTLSNSQIIELYNNRTNVIASNELSAEEIWKACITPNDGTIDGEEKCSNNLRIKPTTFNYINSCTTMNSSGSYYLENNILNSSESTCMNINADNVIFDCQNHVLDGNYISSNYGINISRNSLTNANITVKNCVTTDWKFYGTYLKNVNNISFENINFNSLYLVLTPATFAGCKGEKCGPPWTTGCKGEKCGPPWTKR